MMRQMKGKGGEYDVGKGEICLQQIDLLISLSV